MFLFINYCSDIKDINILTLIITVIIYVNYYQTS